jgi:hypothetical protein
MKRKHRRILQTVIAAILLVIGVMLWLGAVGYVRGVRDLRLPRASLLATTMPEFAPRRLRRGRRSREAGGRWSTPVRHRDSIITSPTSSKAGSQRAASGYRRR